MKRFLAFLLLLSALTSQAGTYGPDVRVQVIVEAKTSEGTFRDAIYYSKAEFEALTDKQISDAKAARVAAWVAAVQAAKSQPAPVLTKAELQAQLDELNKQVAEVSAKILVAPGTKPTPDPGIK